MRAPSMIVLARICTDLVLVLAWVFLASEQLASPAAALGAAIFASVIAWFWASAGQDLVGGQASSRVPVTEGLTRLGAFLRSGTEAKVSALRDAETGLHQLWYVRQRIDEEARRCRRNELSMAVIVLKLKAGNLADWTGDAWKAASGQAASALGLVQDVELCAALRPYELVACLLHADRATAERTLAGLGQALAGDRWEAGIAVFPEGEGNPDAMIELARLRATALAEPAAKNSDESMYLESERSVA